MQSKHEVICTLSGDCVQVIGLWKLKVNAEMSILPFPPGGFHFHV